MKILCVTNLYPPYVIGGYELLAHRTMTTLEERGHEVHVATGQGEYFADIPSRYTIYDVNLDTKHEFYNPPETTNGVLNRLVFNRAHYERTKDLIEWLQPDIVSFWSLWQLTIAPMLAARRTGVPSVTHLTDSWLLHNFTENVNALVKLDEFFTVPQAYLRAGFRRILYYLTRPDNLIIPSHSLTHTYTKTNFGFPDTAFHHVPHGIDTSLFPAKWDVEDDDDPRQDDDVVRLLYVGQLWAGKGVQFLLRAIGGLMREGRSNFHLNIYGSGTENFLDYTKNIIAEEQIQDFVELKGTVPYDDLPAVYRAHDVLVFPSIWNEPFALVPLEAMASGLAILATTAGGTQEAVRHEETGLIVPKADSAALAEELRRLLNNPDLCETFARAGAQRARAEYDLQHMVNRVEKLYQSLTMAI